MPVFRWYFHWFSFILFKFTCSALSSFVMRNKFRHAFYSDGIYKPHGGSREMENRLNNNKKARTLFASKFFGWIVFGCDGMFNQLPTRLRQNRSFFLHTAFSLNIRARLKSHCERNWIPSCCFYSFVCIQCTELFIDKINWDFKKLLLPKTRKNYHISCIDKNNINENKNI